MGGGGWCYHELPKNVPIKGIKNIFYSNSFGTWGTIRTIKDINFLEKCKDASLQKMDRFEVKSCCLTKKTYRALCLLPLDYSPIHKATRKDPVPNWYQLKYRQIHISAFAMKYLTIIAKKFRLNRQKMFLMDDQLTIS